MRLLVVALDAICPERVRALGDRLPALNALVADGQMCEVQITGDPCSPQLWASFATGLPVGEHAVRGLTRGGTGELWRADALPRGRLPDVMLNRQGLTAGLFNLPVVTYPVRPLAGWMASGDMLYPQGFYPSHLASAMEPYPRCSGRYDYPAGPVSETMVASKHDAIFNEFMARGQVSFRNLVRLLEWQVPAVAIAYWHCFDSMQHHLLYDDERMAEAYHLADSFVGELCEQFVPEQVLVVSDHGMRLPDDSDAPALLEIGSARLLEMDSDGHRWLSSGIHTGQALCVASWPHGSPSGPMAIHEVLPWAFKCCGLEWRPVDTDSGGDCADQMSERERELVLRRLRELGYV